MKKLICALGLIPAFALAPLAIPTAALAEPEFMRLSRPNPVNARRRAEEATRRDQQQQQQQQ